MNDFSEISEITSENGLLIIELVRHILEKFPEEMPTCYKHFIANVSKPTSVRGLLQVLSPEPLEYLEQYCKEELNIRTHPAQQQLKCIVSSLPAIWPDLDAMCSLENSEYLPKEAANIMLKILQMRYLNIIFISSQVALFRTDMFVNATKRSNSDFVQWPNPIEEHPTQCYPNLPLWRYPNKYKVKQLFV